MRNFIAKKLKRQGGTIRNVMRGCMTLWERKVHQTPRFSWSLANTQKSMDILRTAKIPALRVQTTNGDWRNYRNFSGVLIETV